MFLRNLGAHILVSLLLTTAPITVCAAEDRHPDSSSWDNLVAADFSNVDDSGGVWTLDDGILTASEDKILWTSAEYGDCTIDLEFQFGAGANSGVFVYASDLSKWTSSAVEIQIADDAAEQWASAPASWRCGAFFGHQAAKPGAVKPAGKWNRMTITCDGPKIDVMLNGELVNQIDLMQWTEGDKNPDGSEMAPWLQGKPWAELPKRGHIGFQGKHAGAPIAFRNLKIKAK